MLLTTPQAADQLGLKPGTLETWRVHGGGPAYVKLGKAVRYSQEDLDAFIAERIRKNTSSREAAR